MLLLGKFLQVSDSLWLSPNHKIKTTQCRPNYAKMSKLSLEKGLDLALARSWSRTWKWTSRPRDNERRSRSRFGLKKERLGLVLVLLHKVSFTSLIICDTLSYVSLLSPVHHSNVMTGKLLPLNPLSVTNDCNLLNKREKEIVHNRENGTKLCFWYYRPVLVCKWPYDKPVAHWKIFIANKIARQLQNTCQPIFFQLTRKLANFWWHWPIFIGPQTDFCRPIISTKRSTNPSAALPISADNQLRRIEHVLFGREKSADIKVRMRYSFYFDIRIVGAYFRILFAIRFLR